MSSLSSSNFCSQTHDSWDDPTVQEQDKFALRTEQLLCRRLEVYLAYINFKTMIDKVSSESGGEYLAVQVVE